MFENKTNNKTLTTMYDEIFKNIFIARALTPPLTLVY